MYQGPAVMLTSSGVPSNRSASSGTLERSSKCSRLSIPAEVRPSKDQPYYHLYAENAETEYVAYVSEQNLLPDDSGDPVRHPQVAETFERDDDGRYRPLHSVLN